MKMNLNILGNFMCNKMVLFILGIFFSNFAIQASEQTTSLRKLAAQEELVYKKLVELHNNKQITKKAINELNKEVEINIVEILAMRKQWVMQSNFFSIVGWSAISGFLLRHCIPMIYVLSCEKNLKNAKKQALMGASGITLTGVLFGCYKLYKLRKTELNKPQEIMLIEAIMSEVFDAMKNQ